MPAGRGRAGGAAGRHLRRPRGVARRGGGRGRSSRAAGVDTLPGAAGPEPPQAATAAGPRGANLLNPEISATGDVRLVARDEGPQHDNAIAREFEFSFQSALDPYSKTKIFLTFEDEEIGVEEGYIYWTGLPGGIRADVGKFRQQIGDLNRWHLHALPETEYPLVYQRFLGEEGLSGDRAVALHRAAGLARRRHPRGLAPGHDLGERAALRRRPPAHAARPAAELLAAHPQHLRAARLHGDRRQQRRRRSPEPAPGARLPLHLPPARGGHPPGHHLPGRGIPAPRHRARRDAPTATAPSWTSRRAPAAAGSSARGTTTPRRRAGWRTPNGASRRRSPGGRASSSTSGSRASTGNSDLEGTQNLLTFQAVWAMGPHKHETY